MMGSDVATIQYSLLHNRKTGGTALKDIIDQQKERRPELSVHCFGHAMSFPRFVKECPQSVAIFFVRDPISRFVSGFYSRFRQGKPRYNFPWSSAEAKAFAHYQTPNQLAEALSSASFYERNAAKAAMKSIGHVKHTYLDFLGPLSLLDQEKARIAFIGDQSEFDADLARLRKLLLIDDDIAAPEDEVRAHKNPSNLDKYLSDKAVTNLNDWYQADYDIYLWCLDRRKQIISETAL